MAKTEIRANESNDGDASSLREKDYARYGMHIGEILEDCGCRLDDETRSLFSLLTQTTGRVDRLIDDTRCSRLRDQYRTGVLDILNGESHVTLPDSVDSDVRHFRRLMDERGCLIGVSHTVEEMFSLQEELRNTEDIHRYVDLTLKEGEGLAELVLHVAGGTATDTAKKIARLIGPPANLFDHAFDAKRDRANGEIAFEPNGRFYGTAIKAGLPKLLHVFGAYPNKLKGAAFFMRRVKNAWETRKYMDPSYESV